MKIENGKSRIHVILHRDIAVKSKQNEIQRRKSNRKLIVFVCVKKRGESIDTIHA